jgi:hypothetical protein
MTQKPVNVLGMDLDQWNHESCHAHFGVGDDWATLYHIESADPGKGHATELLTAAKAFYEAQGKRFAGTVALSDRMKRIYERLGITEYDNEE